MHNVQASVHYLTHCIQRADFHLVMTMICIIHAPNFGPIAQSAICYMGFISIGTYFTYEQSSSYWRTN